jgi:hypothetical protein
MSSADGHRTIMLRPVEPASAVRVAPLAFRKVLENRYAIPTTRRPRRPRNSNPGRS